MKQPPSIFNDVIGPVMRGSSSSHTAAAVRIGRIARQMVKGKIKKVDVVFDENQPLAASYHGHGSDMGLAGGLLGLEPKDPGLVTALKDAKEQNIDMKFRIEDLKTKHPNVYIITVESEVGEAITFEALSTGGGMIEINKLNDIEVSIKGDYYETLLFYSDEESNILKEYMSCIENCGMNYENILLLQNKDATIINLKTTQSISKEVLDYLKEKCPYSSKIEISPVLPVMNRREYDLPFNSVQEMIQYGGEKDYQLWELALTYECKRGNLDKESVLKMMENLVSIMEDSIDSGLKGTTYEDRILKPQAKLIKENNNKLFTESLMNSVIESITAIMEVKSSMGVIVAAPTAGACGGLPGTLIGVARAMNLSFEDIVKAMLAAGLIGVFIAKDATFAGELGGCQVECGSGSAMAAAGLVQLAGGTVQQAVDAASIALQNMLGLVCDPVADRVEVPCLGRNILAGSNAVTCANMVLAGFDKVIPLEEVINTLYNISFMLPVELRCTGLGGLSITETAKDIYRNLNGIEIEPM